jgi:hypothetical protein
MHISSRPLEVDTYVNLLVRHGHRVRITDRGKPIECIRPLEKSDESVELAQLSRLLASGGLKLASGHCVAVGNQQP